MALVKLNPMFVGIRGTVGRNMVLKHYATRIVLSRKPVFRNRIFTEAQRASQERFREATRYAKRLMADPRAREAYRRKAEQSGKPIMSLIVGDYLGAALPGPSGPQWIHCDLLQTGRPYGTSRRISSTALSPSLYPARSVGAGLFVVHRPSHQPWTVAPSGAACLPARRLRAGVCHSCW